MHLDPVTGKARCISTTLSTFNPEIDSRACGFPIRMSRCRYALPNERRNAEDLLRRIRRTAGVLDWRLVPVPGSRHLCRPAAASNASPIFAAARFELHACTRTNRAVGALRHASMRLRVRLAPRRRTRPELFVLRVVGRLSWRPRGLFPAFGVKCSFLCCCRHYPADSCLTLSTPAVCSTQEVSA